MFQQTKKNTNSITCGTNDSNDSNDSNSTDDLDSWTETETENENETENIASNHLFYTDDEKGLKTISNDNAIVRIFSKQKFKFDQQIYDSSCTYWGMGTVLEKMYEWNTIDPNKICILCPIYKLGDTQAGGGGKITKYNVNNKWQYEKYHKACQEEIAEELRINAVNFFHASNTLVQTPQKKFVVTNIYQFKVNDCNPINPFHPQKYCAKERRGIDIYTKRIGYIIWGTYVDCMSMVSKINPCDPNDPLIDGIEGISIVSLRKAIRMTKNASKFLSGNIHSSWNAYE